MKKVIQQWFHDLACLSEIDTKIGIKIDISRWRTFHYTYKRDIYTQTELAEKLIALGAVTGWLTETSQVVWLQNQSIVLQQLPLAGEFYQGTLHWQLTRLPPERWELHQHELVACQEAEATHLGEWVEQIARGGGRLCYWRLWQPKNQSQADQSGEQVDNAPYSNIALLSAIKGVSL